MNLSTAMPPSRRRIVLVKGTEGLGNRILALLSAILYARLAGRTVVVDWRDGFYADPGTNAFPLLFRSDVAVALKDETPSGSVAPWMWERRLCLTATEMEKVLAPHGIRGCPFVGGLYSFDPRDLGHAADVLVMWSLISVVGQLRRHFAGRWSEWRGLGDDDILARLLHEHLQLHPTIVAQVDAVRQAWPDRPRIGVHVRHTDRKTNLRRLRRRLDALVARLPHAVIFLATDAAGVEEDFRGRYGDVLTVPKWFPASGPLHGRDSSCPDRLAMARASLVEMRLLTECDHLVVNGDSSFSQIAKLLWRGERRRVIDVGAWAWLPPSVRDRTWRGRDAVRWAPWLWRARRHIRRQQAGKSCCRPAGSGEPPAARAEVNRAAANEVAE
jgi:hypothetical protein